MQPATPPPTTPAIQTVPQQQYQEVSAKGTEIIIELGFELDQLIAYHFIHTGTESLRGDRLVDGTGQGHRHWLTNITASKVTNQPCKSSLKTALCGVLVCVRW